MFEGFDILDRLNAAIRDRLKKEGGFDEPPSVEVLTERLSDFEQKIKLALMSKLGLCLIVSTPEIEGGESPLELVAKVSVLVSENVLQNQSSGGTRITASSAALRVYLTLLNWAPDGWSNLQPLPDVAAIRLTGGQSDGSPVLTYEVALRAITALSVEETEPVALSGTP